MNDTKKFTETNSLIQGRMQDPRELCQFLRDLENEHVPKIVATYLDANNLLLGHQVFLGATSKTFNAQLLYRYYFLFFAKRFILVLNRPNSEDPSPDEDDRKLMDTLRADAQVLSFKPHFEDFVIVGRNSYFSMATGSTEHPKD